MQKKVKGVRLFPQLVGKFYNRRILNYLYSIKFIPVNIAILIAKFLTTVGIKGQADINGIMKVGPTGIRLEIEIKTGDAVQSKEQKNWQKMITNLGGIYIVARCEKQAVKDLLEARHEMERNIERYTRNF